MSTLAVDPAAGETERRIAWVKASAEDRAKLAQARSRTLWQTMVDAAAPDPARDALVAADDAGLVTRLTYGQLLERVRDLSAGLASIGVKRGDRVVLWMTNRLEWVISCFAAVRLGAAVVPINTFLKPPEVQYCIAQSGARHLIMLDRFRKLDMPQMLAQICPEFVAATSPGALYSPAAPDLRNVVLFRRPGQSHTHPGAFDWDTLEAIGRDNRDGWRDVADAMAAQATPADPIMVKYTSGSTGFPKGAVLQQGGFVANGILHSERMGVGRSDIYFSMMPLFHAGGSIYGLMSTLPQGATLVFTEAFDVELALRLLQEERVTAFFGTLGKEVVDLAHERGITFPLLRLAHCHSEAAKAVLPNVTFAFSPYGLTETYGPCAMTCAGDPVEKRFTTGGRPLPGNEIRAVDPATGQDVGPGQIGEAWVRGNVMLGYWNKPDETARAIDKDGWVHCEDLISIDEDGYVTYRGRIKLMAKVGGENVSLEEVEKVVTGHEAITHCAAVPVADQRKVEAVRIYVIRRSDHDLAAEALLDWLRPRLAHFKLPREIVFVEALPRLGSAKLDRLALAEWAKQPVPA